jgi:hypothetical protein
MQSDDENFDEAVESQTPERKTEDPEDRFSLRRTPARSQSEKLLEAKMDQQKLFEDLCKDSCQSSWHDMGSNDRYSKIYFKIRKCTRIL